MSARHVSRVAFATALALSSLAFATRVHADWSANGAPVVVTTGGQSTSGVLADGSGGLYVAWEDTRNGSTDIYCQRLTRAGVPWPGWPAAGVPVCTWTGNQTTPKLCSDGAGGAYVCFVDLSGGTPNADIYLQRVTGTGAIAAGWPAASTQGVPVCRAANRQTLPRPVEDGAGGAYLSWLDQRFGGGGYDVATTHVLANASVDSRWPFDGLDPFNDVYSEEATSAAADGGGGLWLVWADARQTPFSSILGYDLCLTHLGPDGAAYLPFTAAGSYITNTAGSQYMPSLVPDGEGGVLVAFRDARTGSGYDVYATRIDAGTGVHAGWPALNTALPLSTATADQDVPLAVTDGAHGAIVVWKDFRSTPTWRLYGERVTAAGAIAPGWGTAAGGGLALGDGGADQQQHALLADGAGGAYLAWRDGRNGGQDIYALRVTGAGTPAAGWPASGIAVCTAAGNQQVPQLVTDNAGGAYVVWSDFRADLGDLYAAHLTPQGLADPVAAVAPAAARFALRLASPSPAAGGAEFALEMRAAGAASVVVVDAAGRRVRTLLAGETLAAGSHTVRWDARLASGAAAPAGLYFAVASAGGERRTTRLVLLN